MDSATLLALALGSQALKEPIWNILNPVAKKSGDALGDLWDIAFGGLHTYAEKKSADRAYAISQFKKKLTENICSIPPENLQEPPLSVVGPALESAKYHFEVPELRDMFASLIASSMNTDKCDNVHPSFVEMLRQMDSYDAHNFSLFSNLSLPSAQYRVVYKSKPPEMFIFDFIASGKPYDNAKRMAASISFLERLGLIYLQRSIPPLDEHKYFNNNAFMVDESKALSLDSDFDHIDVICGCATLTSVGKLLYETCVNEI